MSVGIVPIVRSSNHTYPFRWNKPPETGPDAAEKHWMAQQEQDQEYMFRMLNGEMSNMFNHLGATIPAKRWADLIPDSNDIWLSLTIPEFEYDRPDWDHRVEFVGMLLTVGVENQSLPPWWDDVIKAKKAGKTIVAASASSLDFVPENLVLPAMDAFRNRDDVFVVAALVNFDPAVLNYEVPANAHIAKFIPMNKLLPLVDVLVTSAGYGTVQHSLRNGVPLLLSGQGQDKPHTGPLAEWSGVGVYIEKNAVSPKEIEETVDKILSTPSYKEKATEMAESYKNYEPIQKIDALIKESLAKLDTL